MHVTRCCVFATAESMGVWRSWIGMRGIYKHTGIFPGLACLMRRQTSTSAPRKIELGIDPGAKLPAGPVFRQWRNIGEDGVLSPSRPPQNAHCSLTEGSDSVPAGARPYMKVSWCTMHIHKYQYTLSPSIGHLLKPGHQHPAAPVRSYP